MAAVFLAYSSKDLGFVTRLREQLRIRSQHEVFVAEFSLSKGVEWRMEVERSLSQADFFVPLISRAFLDSPEARRELNGAIDLADQKSLVIIPILIEDLPSTLLPIIIKATQYIRFQPFDGMLEELLRSLTLRKDPLMDLETLKDHVLEQNLTPSELSDLARDIPSVRWPKLNDKSKALKIIGDKLYHQGNLPEALLVFDSAIRLVPNLPGLRMTRAKINCTLGNYQAALDDSDFMLALNSNDPWAALQKFWIYHDWALKTNQHNDKLQECIEALRRNTALKSQTFIGSFGRALAECAAVLNDDSYAVEALELICKNQATVSQIERNRDRISLLQALRTAALRFKSKGDDSNFRRASTEQKNYEDRWRIYSY